MKLLINKNTYTVKPTKVLLGIKPSHIVRDLMKGKPMTTANPGVLNAAALLALVKHLATDIVAIEKPSEYNFTGDIQTSRNYKVQITHREAVSTLMFINTVPLDIKLTLKSLTKAKHIESLESGDLEQLLLT